MCIAPYPPAERPMSARPFRDGIVRKRASTTRGSSAAMAVSQVPAFAAVEVLGVGVARARALRHDEDRRLADLLERVRDEADRAVVAAPGRQPVQEVDDRVARSARVVA